eukprot:Hpha_TRINITY_DN15549_c4_g2::TRINITY_DN15549_c4_g2_i1::g.107191::m.107191
MYSVVSSLAGLVSPAPGQVDCTILDGPFDIFVQVLLAALASSALLCKWRMESPRRSGLVFALDSTKQAGGFFIAHVGNMVVSIALQTSRVSACEWYFMSIFLDCTVQAAVSLWLLYSLNKMYETYGHFPKGYLKVGEYGDPPDLWRWWNQAGLWYAIVLFTKTLFCVVIVIMQRPLGVAAKFVLGDLEDYSRRNGHDLELVLVMMVWPTILDATQLVIQDEFLRSPDPSAHPPISSPILDSNARKRRFQEASLSLDEREREPLLTDTCA